MARALLILLLLASCANPAVEVLMEDLEVPWAIAFFSEGSFLVTERNTGNVYHYKSGTTRVIGGLRSSWIGEGGLLGIAIDPQFEQNQFIYVYYTYEGDEANLNRVSRFVYDETLQNETIILNAIPGARFHNGGRIAFGPDAKLYITTGDALEPSLAQDLTSTAGKILRINPDGSIPSDNPFPNSPVYSYGHRNPQGLAWQDGVLIAPEHGPTRNDEINLITPGTNYGWPLVQCTNHAGYAPPIRCFNDWTLAPSGATFDHNGNLYVAGLRGSQIRKFVMRNNQIVNEEVVLNQFGRLREVKYHEGYLYITTSNRDGRGTVLPGDDKVIRIAVE
jgi:glucose/arabinose dehydrogenase